MNKAIEIRITLIVTLNATANQCYNYLKTKLMFLLTLLAISIATDFHVTITALTLGLVAAAIVKVSVDTKTKVDEIRKKIDSLTNENSTGLIWSITDDIRKL